MDSLTVWTILYVFISGLKATNGGDCIGQDTSQFVCCSLLTVENGKVCYAWHWANSINGNAFAWSSATFSCNPGYVLSSFQNVLQCVRNDNTWCESCGSCHSWNGSFPGCQKQETTSTTTTTTSTTAINANSTTSPSATTATTVSITKQAETTTTTFPRIRDTTERQPSSSPVTVETSLQNVSKSILRPTNNSETVLLPNDDRHNLLLVYIAVPSVVIVFLVVLVALLIICRRKHQKQANDDLHNNRHTGQGNSTYQLNPKQPADYNVVNDHVDGTSSKRDEHYDNLRINASIRYKNFYSHTSQAFDADTYSCTMASAPTSADKTQSTGKGKAALYAEQTYDSTNYPMVQSGKGSDNNSYATNIGPELNATAPIDHADAAEETNLYAVVCKKTK